MKEAIEDVVSKLERSMRVSMNLKKHDKADAYTAAIYLLKEVLAQHGTDDSSRVSGNVGQEAKQIPSETNRN